MDQILGTILWLRTDWRRALAAGLVVLLLAGGGFYWGAPASLLAITQAAQRAAAGLSKKAIEIDGARMIYLEGGSGEIVVLVHGIYAEMDHWDQVAGALTNDFRVIVPDLPGFGESEMPKGGSYSYDEQVLRLHDFLGAMGVRRYHLVGNSMGGAIVGAMAARWPKETLSVSFIGGAPRVPGTAPSDMERVIATGTESPMVVTTKAEYFARFQFLFHDMPFIPGPILSLWAAREASDPVKNRRIWDEVWDEHASDFPQSIPDIVAPTFILWGEKDRVFDVSGAYALAKQIPGSQIHIIPDCGHLPMLEHPGETGALLAAFLRAKR